MQTSYMIKSFDTKQREQILKNFNHTDSVPQEAVASMKSLLGMTWNSIRDIRRWLSMFKVSLAPEK